ncbi:MAG: ATP-binding cassette domain-containing protein [Candidatus Omnitrophica bacterium]|nr:ATP-binding cassette domain-containing protein [Candidatus Omnitrophota bacterium]
MIEIKNLTKSFDGYLVLDNISLKVDTGGFFTLMGGSGQGKSVFLQHIIGLLKPDSGTIFIDSQDVTGLSENELLALRSDAGYLFQEGALFDYLNIFDNLALPIREHTKKEEGEILKMVEAALSEVELEGIAEKFPVQISVGMRKRVALARAIILRPKILLCDEPTAGLDPATGYSISRLILKLCHELNTTTIVVTHDCLNFFDISGSIAIIHAGKILAVGNQEEIKSSQDPIVRKFIPQLIH